MISSESFLLYRLVMLSDRLVERIFILAARLAMMCSTAWNTSELEGESR